MKIVAGRGKCQVEIGPELGAMVERVLRETAPRITARFDAKISEIRANSESNWPVGKKSRHPTHSRDQFNQGIRLVSTDTIEAFLRNKASYVFMIRSFQNGLDGKSPFQELMRKPAKKAGEVLAAQLGSDLAAAARGR